MSRESAVRAAFLRQGEICTEAGAPFTGRLCRLVGERLQGGSLLADRILGWAGNPSHEGDALPLRLMGGLHALARAGRAPNLSAVYPPHPAPAEDDALWAIVAAALAAEAPALDSWLDQPPQTNEVGRSAGLMAGLMVLSARYGRPFRLYELGASAGLNSGLDRYAFDLGGVQAGDLASPVRLRPDWRGPPPPAAEVRVIGRAGVDRNPLDAGDAATRTRLAAYVWADQRERLARLEAALDLAVTHPVPLARADAADWLEATLDPAPEPGVCRVVMHTIAFQYFPPESQRRIADRIAAAGARATSDAPLAWLSFEQEGSSERRRPVLRLQSWPGGRDDRLAEGHPHGASYDWFGAADLR